MIQRARPHILLLRLVDMGTMIFLGFDQVINGVEMLVGQSFISDFPQPLSRLHFWGIRRLKEQMDTVWHFYPVTGMPSRLIQHQDQVLVWSQSQELRQFCQGLAEHRRLSHRRRKTDAIDAAAIASLLAAGHGTPLAELPLPTQLLRLTLASLRQAATQQLHRAAALLRSLERLWPGALGNGRRYQRAHPNLPPLRHLVATHPLERQRVRVLLEHCPAPHAIRALDADGLQAIFRQHGLRYGGCAGVRLAG